MINLLFFLLGFITYKITNHIVIKIRILTKNIKYNKNSCFKKQKSNVLHYDSRAVK